jgi:hypothetical protein
MCKTHQKQRGKKKKRETSKTKLQVPLLFHITCHYGREQKPDLGFGSTEVATPHNHQSRDC